ncbi:3-dehydroquinate synthase II [Paractinoplanes ferrugineus]|uniref:3-dehydroquinate synthase II n=1 Tax=Paractinoplanes ferrugineus TaxID=113564 RepID=A0A919J9J2_9ACTN|nr:3-dehydroquinate synthase II family protein [Actinoplanes ferrugineus]GIE13086.1 3-dehydroquinate synthase II [Actinoplanes ferrugineus]
MKSAWIDLRGLAVDLAVAVIEESTHLGIATVVLDDPELAQKVPPTLQKAAVVTGETPTVLIDRLVEVVDILIAEHDIAEKFADVHPDLRHGVLIRVLGEETLQLACRIATEADLTLVEFQQDPSKIPLEILLAAADKAKGSIVTVVEDVEDAMVTIGVLERGSDAVLLAPRRVGDASELVRVCQGEAETLGLQELEVVKLTHVGLGDRVCVDTCSHLRPNEGILVGAYATGLVLVSSETHPLPYMPTRPFRVNAAALSSYTLTPGNRTRYLSELQCGSEILAVNTDGGVRRVVVCRIKMETRPMLKIEARTAGGDVVNVVGQDDWHVRALGPGASVHNFTELRPGDRILGHTMTDQRHVGYAIREFLHEQ